MLNETDSDVARKERLAVVRRFLQKWLIIAACVCVAVFSIHQGFWMRPEFPGEMFVAFGLLTLFYLMKLMLDWAVQIRPK